MKKLILLLFAAVIGSVTYGQRPYNPSEMTEPYYLDPMFISVNGGIFLIQKEKTISPPLYLNPSIVLVRNFELGIEAIHYTYKHYVEYDGSTPTTDLTLFPEDLDNFNHLFVGLKGSYHLSNLLLKYAKINFPKKLDIYATGMGGTNMVWNNSDATDPANTDFEPTEPRFGFGAGLRYIRTKRFALTTEFGINDYGYGSLGLTYFVSKGK